MATQQPYFNNGIFSPVASEQNLGQIFGERSAAVNDLENQTRASFLAERQMPSQLSGFELQNQKNLAGLSTLPQETALKQDDLKMQEKFQTIQQILSARAEQNLPPEVRQAVIEGGVSKILDLNMGIDPKQPLGSIDRQAAKKRAYQYFIQMANENPQGFEAELRKSLSALSMTRKGTEQYDLETQKGELDIVKSLMSADPQPSDNSGASFDRLWKISQAQVATAARDLDAAMKREAAKRSIRLIVDQGQIIGQEKQNKDGSITLAPLDSTVIAEIEKVTEPQKKRFEAAERGFLQLAPEQYTKAYKGQQAPTGGSDKPQVKSVTTKSGNKVVIERQ